MKLTERFRFPHPVLWSATNDYIASDLFGFDGEVVPEEFAISPTITFRIAMQQAHLAQMIEAQELKVGISVTCPATYFDDVRDASIGENKMQFEPQSLSGEVRLRPLVWLAKGLPPTQFEGVSPEYSGLAYVLDQGTILAVGEERVISVGREKQTPLASIFKLEERADLNPFEFRVGLDSDFVQILAGVEAHKTIAGLRNGPPSARAILLASVYLSVVQATLAELAGEDAGSFEAKRWYAVIMARLNSLNITRDQIEPLRHAQLLLQYPLEKINEKVLQTND